MQKFSDHSIITLITENPINYDIYAILLCHEPARENSEPARENSEPSLRRVAWPGFSLKEVKWLRFRYRSTEFKILFRIPDSFISSQAIGLKIQEVKEAPQRIAAEQDYLLAVVINTNT